MVPRKRKGIHRMTVEVAVLTGLVTAFLSVVSTVASWRHTSRKEGVREGAQQATLDHIRSRVDEMWAGYRRLENRFAEMDRRLLTLEMEQEKISPCSERGNVVSYPQMKGSNCYASSQHTSKV